VQQRRFSFCCVLDRTRVAVSRFVCASCTSMLSVSSANIGAPSRVAESIFFRSRICDPVRNPRARGSSRDPREILRKGRVQIPTQVLPRCHFILVVHRILNKANMTPGEHLGRNLNAPEDALEDRAHVTYLFLACSTRHKKRVFRTPKIMICLFF